MEQQVIKETVSFLGMHIDKITFYTSIAVAVVTGAIGTAWYYIRKKLGK